MSEYIKFSGKSESAERIDFSSFTGVILCGGLGTRLADITVDQISGERIPKPLVTVAGKSLVDFTTEPLYEVGVGRFIYIAAQNAPFIEKHMSPILEQGRGYVSSCPLGEGVAVEIQQGLQEDDCPGPIVLSLADVIRDGFDPAEALQYHVETDADITFVGGRTAKKNPSSVIISDADNNTISLFRNRQKVNIPDAIVSLGMTICSRKVTDILRSLRGDEFEPSDSLHPLKNYLLNLGLRAKTYIAPNTIRYFNINKPDSIQEAERVLL